MKQIAFVIDDDLVFAIDHQDTFIQLKNEGVTVLHLSVTRNMPKFNHEQFEYIYYGSFETLFELRQKNIPIITYGIGDMMLRSQYIKGIDNSLFLNSDSVMTTLDELKENYEIYSDKFQSKNLFVRPDDGMKSFTGKVLDKSFKGLEEYENIDVWVSAPKDVGHEYRFWIIDGQICEHSPVHIYHSDLMTAAKNFAQSSKIDKAYVLDLTMYNNKAVIVEFNSFSCSDLKLSDSYKIMRKIISSSERLS